MVQTRQFRWNELFQRAEIDLSDPQSLRWFGRNPANSLKETPLTRVYRPMGILHQALRDRDWWPQALSPEIRFGSVPGESGPEVLDQELQRGLDQMNEFLRNDPALQEWARQVRRQQNR